MTKPDCVHCDASPGLCGAHADHWDQLHQQYEDMQGQ